ncbi:MAG: MFS transporter [Holophagales bacterium]|nr:MFS transporter [Holophagales bacterium]
MTSKLCALWLAYFAGLGIFFPFYSLYLSEELSLSGMQVGLVLSIIPMVGLISQPAWGLLADRTGSRRHVLALVILGVAVAYGGLGFLRDFPSVLVGTAALALFSTSVVPIATAVSLAAQATQVGEHGGKARGADFGFVRMWGTLGFLASVVAFPHLLTGLQSLAGPWQGLGWMFPVIAVLSLLAAPIALTLPRTAALTVRSRRGDTRQLLRHPPVLRLLFLVFCAHLCLQGPINLFPLLITERGGDMDTVSRMWVFMLLLEIPLIGFSGPTLRRFGPRALLAVGLIAEGIRWTVSAFSPHLGMVQAVQLLHGVGVAGILIGAPLYLELAAPERQRATGQGLIASVGFGLGAILSIGGTGWLFDRLSPEAPYALAGAGALLLGCLVYRVLPDPYRPDLDDAPAVSGSTTRSDTSSQRLL